MKKPLFTFLGIFMAVAAMMAIGTPARAQITECGDRICCISSNPNACDSCFQRAGQDPAKACECSCKYLNLGITEAGQTVSYRECVADNCSAATGGGTKISRGSVFGGVVYPNQWGAYGAATQFVIDHELQDSVQIVMKDFSRITNNVDSWFYHFIGLDANIQSDLPEGVGMTTAMASYTYCTAGLNQDGNNIATDGCQRGSGCRELPPGLVPGLCGLTTACCKNSAGCTTGDTAVDGRYGTSTAVCP